MSLSRFHWLLILSVALLLRLAAWGWNAHPWGDMTTDASVTRFYAETGQLGVDETGPHYYPLSERGYRPADQRPPGVPWLAAKFMVSGMDAYTALKVLGFLAGLACIPLTVALARRMWPDRPVAPVAWAVAACYFLADNSANGNLYMIQAAGVLATLVDYPRNRGRAALWLGLTYMVNYQASFLWFALLADLVIRHGVRRAVTPALIFFGTALLVASPLFIRNAQVFGNPLYQINSTTFANKSGVPARWDRVGDDYLHVFEYDKRPRAERLRTMARWTAQNVGYTGRQLLFIGGLFLVGLCLNLGRIREIWADDDRRPVLLATAAYAGILLIFPIVKYRFLILLLMMIFIMALPKSRLFAICCALSVVVLSITTGVRTGLGPVYYSGALTDSAARDNDRAHFATVWNNEEAIAQIVRETVPAGDKIMATRTIQWLTHRPTVQPPHSNRSNFLEIFDHYDCKWLAGNLGDPGEGFELIRKFGDAGLWRRN